MDIEEKRKDFLEKLERSYAKYDNLFGPGVVLKIKRFFRDPIVYGKYILWRLKIISNLKARLFWGRRIIFKKNKFGLELCFVRALDDVTENKLKINI